MKCKHFDKTPDNASWCGRSSILIDYDGNPHDIIMKCEFRGDAQKCLDNPVELNNRNIFWKDYTTIRLKETTPDLLELKHDLEDERMQKIAEELKSGRIKKEKHRK